MLNSSHTIHIGEHLLDIVQLPEAAQQELVTFYEFLIFKYQRQQQPVQSEKQRILSQIFQEAHGTLPLNYTFNREELHER